MSKKLSHELTSQHLAFVENYMVHFSARRAAKEAGYAQESYAYELLRKPKIKAEIEKRTQAASDARVGLKDRVIEELTSIAFSTLSDVGRFGPSGLEVKDHDQIPDSTKRAIQEFTVKVDKDNFTQKVRFHNKVQALEILGKHLGMFKDQEVSVNIKPYIIRRRNGEEVELGIKEESSEEE